MKVCNLVAAVLVGTLQAVCHADFSKVDERIQQWVDEKDYPGCGIWIIDRDGNTLHEKYWGDFTRDTTVMIASATKWLEAATVMTLVDDKKLDLDVPIVTYLPELTGVQGQNTLRQMLSHTSSITGTKIDETQPVATFPSQLASTHPDVKPGERFKYGGTALGVAWVTVERVTGKPWLLWFGERIAKPLRMKTVVTGHDLWTYSRLVGGDVTPRACSADYMNFLRMILNDGVFEGTRVLSAESVREMQADQVGLARVERPTYPEKTLGQMHTGIYGFGEWRMVVNDRNDAQVVASTSFAGFIPWIDKRHGIAAIFVGRNAGKIDAFHSSAELIRLVDEAMEAPRPATP